MNKIKNITEVIKNNVRQYKVSVTGDKKRRIQRYFKNIDLAKAWLKNFNKDKNKEILDLSELSKLQKADIRTALSLLHKNVSLVDCVKAYNFKIKDVSLKKAIEEFIELKKNKICEKYCNDIKSKLDKFDKYFKEWDNIEPLKLSRWIKEQSKSSKTQKHYFSIVKEFYDYAKTKKYTEDIFTEIHKTEIPKVQRQEKSILYVDETKQLFEELENKTPELAGLYALVAFGGFRIMEAQKLEKESFNYEKKEIVLKFKDSKTGQSWLQCKMPSNLWEWLEKYPINENWKNSHVSRIIKNKISISLERNILRHSFATYHLSLNRNAPETSILLRHTNPSQLWQSYLEGLTDTDTAKAYFNIVPSQKDLKAENGTNEDYNIEIANSCRTSVSH